MSVNKVILVGRLGRDPETRYIANGTAVANFTLATDESYKDRSGEKQKKTEWHRLVAWGKLAEIVQKYLKKGALIYVEGKIQTDSWEKDGEKKYATKVIVSVMRMLEPKSSGAARSAAEEIGDAHEPEITDEDIPF